MAAHVVHAEGAPSLPLVSGAFEMGDKRIGLNVIDFPTLVCASVIATGENDSFGLCDATDTEGHALCRVDPHFGPLIALSIVKSDRRTVGLRDLVEGIRSPHLLQRLTIEDPVIGNLAMIGAPLAVLIEDLIADIPRTHEAIKQGLVGSAGSGGVAGRPRYLGAFRCRRVGVAVSYSPDHGRTKERTHQKQYQSHDAP